MADEQQVFIAVRVTLEEAAEIDDIVNARNEQKDGRHSRQSVIAIMIRRGLKEARRAR